MMDGTLVFTNTHLLLDEFEYVAPGSVNEACAILAERDDARLLAGGTDLLVQMKVERARVRSLVDLRRVPGLRGIVADGGVTIGAMASIRAVSRAAPVRARYAALREACDSFSTVQVMVMGTIGGNVCNASPAADTAPALLVFDAAAVITGPEGERSVPTAEFFVAPGRTVLRRGEMLQSLRLPAVGATSGSAFLKIGRVTADIAKVSAAVRLDREGDHVADCRVALGAVAPTPVRSLQAERMLRGRKLSPALVAEAARAAEAEIRPITDARSTAEYRRQAAGVLVADVIRAAWTRSGGKEIA